MASENQTRVQECVGAIPPKDDVLLVGWVLMAEWEELDGQKLLTRLISEHSSAWQVKGYLHEGLYTQWPANLEHHNPGYGPDWTAVTLPHPRAPVRPPED